MKNKKGFTLIELLAVIVILAIIALIATPIVLNMINSAKKSSAKSSTLGFIDSIEYYAGFHQANSGGDLGIDGYEKEVPTEKCIMENKVWKTCSEFMKDVKLKSKGSAPTDAEIVINSSGKVQGGTWMKYNGYICTYENNDVICGDSSNTSSTPTSDNPSSVVHYDIVPPSETSPTDYTNLGYNVFLKKENDIIQVCVNKDSNISCFNYNNAAEEYEHGKQVFGSENCSDQLCQSEQLYCRFKTNGVVRCDDRIANFSCTILADGDSDCY